MSGGGKKKKRVIIRNICWQMVVENWDTYTKIKIKMLYSQHFYSTFTTNLKFHVTCFYWWGKKVILVVGSN